MGSIIVGRKLKDIALGEHTLIIAIEREGESLSPNRDDIIMAGDIINIMVGENREINLREKLERICICKDSNIK